MAAVLPISIQFDLAAVLALLPPEVAAVVEREQELRVNWDQPIKSSGAWPGPGWRLHYRAPALGLPSMWIGPESHTVNGIEVPQAVYKAVRQAIDRFIEQLERPRVGVAVAGGTP